MPQERVLQRVPRAYSVAKGRKNCKGKCSKVRAFSHSRKQVLAAISQGGFLNRILAPFCHPLRQLAVLTTLFSVGSWNRIVVTESREGGLEKGKRRSLINNDSGQNQRNVAKQRPRDVLAGVAADFSAFADGSTGLPVSTAAAAASTPVAASFYPHFHENRGEKKRGACLSKRLLRSRCLNRASRRWLNGNATRSLSTSTVRNFLAFTTSRGVPFRLRTRGRPKSLP